MKRNKLTLTAGILMVIVASLSILMVVDYTVWFVECVQILYQVKDSITLDNIGYVLDTVFILGLVIISLTESILYMIWGVKLIKKTNKGIPVSKMKGLIVTMLVFSYVLAFIHMGDVSGLTGPTGLFLAIAILLTVAVSKTSTPVKVVSNQSEKILDEKTIEKISAIKKLKDDNVISEEEYQKLRDKVLNDIVNTQDK